MSTDPIIIIKTADGKTAGKGQLAFDYYSGKGGIILEHPDSEGWFRFLHFDGTDTLLNGERIAIDLPIGNGMYHSDEYKLYRRFQQACEER